MSSVFTERRANLLRTATHIDPSGNVYKMVNGAWWVFRDVEYALGLKYPAFVKCEDAGTNSLVERNIKHL